MTTDFLSIYLDCEEKIYLVWYEHCRQYPVGKSNLHLYKTRVINLKYLKKILT